MARLQAGVVEQVSVWFDFERSSPQRDAILRTIMQLSGVIKSERMTPDDFRGGSYHLYHIPVQQAYQEMFKQEFDAFVAAVNTLLENNEFYICGTCKLVMLPVSMPDVVVCRRCSAHRERQAS